MSHELVLVYSMVTRSIWDRAGMIFLQMSIRFTLTILFSISLSALFFGRLFGSLHTEQVQDVRKRKLRWKRQSARFGFLFHRSWSTCSRRVHWREQTSQAYADHIWWRGIPKAKLKQLYDLFGDRIQLENVYGPTECTCICSAYTISAADFDDMQNLAPWNFAQNFDFEILNPEDTSDTGMGELFLRDQSRPRILQWCWAHSAPFIQNPKQAKFLELGYRTGDLVQLDAREFYTFKGVSISKSSIWDIG